MDRKDIYLTLVQHSIAAENISWNRFNNFLVFNSIIILAWVAAYNELHFKLLLTALSILGIFSGILWAGLGLRGRDNVSLFLDIGKNMETISSKARGPFSKAIDLRDKGQFAFCGSRIVISLVPLSLSFIHIILLHKSLPSNNILPFILRFCCEASVFIVTGIITYRVIIRALLIPEILRIISSMKRLFNTIKNKIMPPTNNNSRGKVTKIRKLLIDKRCSTFYKDTR